MNSYIAAANNAISKFDYSIRSTISQHDRTRFYALVNNTSDPLTQLATTRTADEVAFVKRVLDAMFDTYNTQRQEVMAITSMQALRLHKPSASDQRRDATQSTQAGLSMDGAERLMGQMVEEGWFEKSRAGFYSLSPRALIELKQYLVATYNSSDQDEDDDEQEGNRYDKIKFCQACKELVTVVCLPKFSFRLLRVCVQLSS